MIPWIYHILAPAMSPLPPHSSFLRHMYHLIPLAAYVLVLYQGSSGTASLVISNPIWGACTCISIIRINGRSIPHTCTCSDLSSQIFVFEIVHYHLIKLLQSFHQTRRACKPGAFYPGKNIVFCAIELSE